MLERAELWFVGGRRRGYVGATVGGVVDGARRLGGLADRRLDNGEEGKRGYVGATVGGAVDGAGWLGKLADRRLGVRDCA